MSYEFFIIGNEGILKVWLTALIKESIPSHYFYEIQFQKKLFYKLSTFPTLRRRAFGMWRRLIPSIGWMVRLLSLKDSAVLVEHFKLL